MEKAIGDSIYQGANVDDKGYDLPHLFFFFVDDTLFMAEWNGVRLQIW